MNLQYISDKSGHTTAVQLQIPIEEWESLKKKYTEFEDEENAISCDIPDWQKELVRKELQYIAEGKTELLEWDVTKKHFNL